MVQTAVLSCCVLKGQRILASSLRICNRWSKDSEAGVYMQFDTANLHMSGR